MQDYSEALLSLLQTDAYQALKSKELARELEVKKKYYKRFRDLLRELEAAGKITRSKGGRWLTAQASGLVQGSIQVKRRGFGFLLPDDPALEDIYIPEDKLGGAFHGDKVAVRVRKHFRGRGSRIFGKVEKIIERVTKRLVGVVEKRGKKYYCLPENVNIPHLLLITNVKSAPSFQPNDKVLLELKEWPGLKQDGCGEVLERLGPAGEPDTETAAILAGFNAPGAFPKEVLDEVRELSPELTEIERQDRLDYTNEICFTIDPQDARDFDDAISIKQTKDGYELGVHIADVSHYVKPGSALYEEAGKRSTSIYLPERVIPMLPEEIANNICSLRPNEERPVLSVFFKMNQDAEISSWHCGRSLIKSHHRFAYEDVYKLLNDEKEAQAFANQELLDKLRILYDLTMKLRKARLEKGSIELDLPEYRVVLSPEGEAVGMTKVTHDFSHQMIEECMLLANQVMARYGAKNRLPILYRTHDAPADDSLRELSAFLNAYGYNFKLPFKRAQLNQILELVKDKPESHAINLMVLTSMRQAIYNPVLAEHFALAFTHYAHFTSPIRRFPDLHLHLQFKALFEPGQWRLPKKVKKNSSGESRELAQLAMHTSGRERRAMKIEEAVKDLRRLELLRKAEEKIHTAVVTGIRDFGIFVELKDFFVESLLRTSQLALYGRVPKEILPGAGRRITSGGKSRQEKGFHIGEEVKIKIKEISLSERRCQVDFVE